MAISVNFDAVPRGIHSAGRVRFFPRVTGATAGMAGASTFLWSFGDGDTSTDWNPVHDYPATAIPKTYTVSVTVTDASGATATQTYQNFITQNAEDNIDDPQNDGSLFEVSAMLYGTPGSMFVFRTPWDNCTLHMLNPIITASIDKIGTLTFSLLDVGNSTATERALMVEGTGVTFFQGKNAIFSGVVRRVAQNTQCGFEITTRVKLWDFECDSDLARLKKLRVNPNSYNADGDPYYDTPGNIVRAILAPEAGEFDTRGVINCTDTKIVYKLNSQEAEDSGSRYEHLMTLHGLTNYDLVTRPVFRNYLSPYFDGVNYLTIGGYMFGARENMCAATLSDWSVLVVGGIETITYKYDAWRTIDQGLTWMKVTEQGWTEDYREGERMVILSDDTIILVGGSNQPPYSLQVLSSSDGGISFTSVCTTSPWTGVEGHSLVRLSTDKIVLMGGVDTMGTRSNTVYTSVNKGVAWATATPAAGWSARAGHGSVVLSGDVILLAGGFTAPATPNDEVWTSSDGITWTQTTVVTPFTARTGEGLCKLSDGTLLLIGGYGDVLYDDVWKSVDNGANWTQQATGCPFGGIYSHAVVVNDDDSILIIGGYPYSNNVWRSEDEGVTWQLQISGFTPDAMIGYMLYFTGPYGETPQLYTWHDNPIYGSAGNYFKAEATYHTLLDSDHLFLVGDKVKFTSDILIPFPLEDDTTYYITTASPTQFKVATTLGGTPISFNIGYDFATENAATGIGAAYGGTIVKCASGKLLYLSKYESGGSGSVWESFNDGRTWSLGATPAYGRRGWSGVCILPNNHVVLSGGYNDAGGIDFVKANDVWLSIDEGETWTRQVANAPWAKRAGHAMVSLSNGHIIMFGGSNNYGGGGARWYPDVWKSEDEGANWTLQTADAEWDIVPGSAYYGRAYFGSCVDSNDRIYLTGGEYVWETEVSDTWYSDDEGQHWIMLAPNYPTAGSMYPYQMITLNVMPDNTLLTVGGQYSWLPPISVADFDMLDLDNPKWYRPYSLRNAPRLSMHSTYLRENGELLILHANASYVARCKTGLGNQYIQIVPDDTKISTFGTISDNNETEFWLTDVVNAGAIDHDWNSVMINVPLDYKIDFANDLSQPSVVKNFDINKTCFEFNDNDDKRKLSTKIIAKGKDVTGATISVAIAAVHKYDDDTQFFEDSTRISLRSEGYIYKNNYAGNAIPVNTVYTAKSETFTTNFAGDPQGIYLAGGGDHYPVGTKVAFSSTTHLASPLVPSQYPNNMNYYYVVWRSGNSIHVSASKGGTAISLTDDTTDWSTCSAHGSFVVDNGSGVLTRGSRFIVTATSMPGNVYENTIYYVRDDPGSSGSAMFDFALTQDGTPAGIGQDQPGSGVVIYPISLQQAEGPLGTIPKVWLYGWGYSVPVGSICAAVSPGVSANDIVTADTPTENIDKNGVMYTEIELDSWLLLDYSGQGYFLNQRLYVDDNSKVGTNEVLIGEELITIDSVGSDSTYGDYIQFADVNDRVSTASIKCYPHDIGALVARTNYTEASPQTGSAYELYGRYIDDRTVDGNITFGTLDTYATNLLLGLGNFYKKATCWVPMVEAYVKRVGEFDIVLQPSMATPIHVSDRLSFTEYTGATPVEYQVVSVKTIFDQGKVELELGDFEKNVFTSLEQKTNAVNRTLT